MTVATPREASFVAVWMDSGSIQMERIAFVSIDIYMYIYQLKQNRRIINDGLLKIYILFFNSSIFNHM